ncbi:MAG: hypothetical protein KZQ93_13610 [Candidatus Thiodiazotropha sp. (ex Monitilora ramsayi)]|nr:hypothetical protein [Candidatus Thiodiazotropha sp. (ex Monitilora ramsayi)]
MDWKARIWKYATMLVVILIVLNPEMAELALFIDAVGLEIFLMLVEIQVIVFFSLLYHNRIKLFLIVLQRIWKNHNPDLSWNNLMAGPERLIIAGQSQAILMYMLVSSAAIGIALNVVT